MLDKEIKKIIHSVSLETYLEKDIVEKVFTGYYKILEDKIKEANIEEYHTFPIVHIPSLGKLYVSNLRVRRINEAKNKANIGDIEQIQ